MAGFGQDKMDTLAVLDQTSAIFNPNGPKLIVGLIEEGRQRIVAGDPNAPQKFNRDAYFGGFVTWRFSEVQKCDGVGMENYLTFLDKYKTSNPAGFSEILQIDSQTVEQIGNINEFVQRKTIQQLDISAQLWNGGDVDFAHAFDGWDTNGKKQLMEQKCQEFKHNFWKS